VVRKSLTTFSLITDHWSLTTMLKNALWLFAFCVIVLAVFLPYFYINTCVNFRSFSLDDYLSWQYHRFYGPLCSSRVCSCVHSDEVGRLNNLYIEFIICCLGWFLQYNRCIISPCRSFQTAAWWVSWFLPHSAAMLCNLESRNSVHLSHSCFVTKQKNRLLIFWYHTKR